ncbi:helix-turn-helix domain-containing protein [uncultured Dysosmobacter sp.]|uniref:helix-turn-helix domain-containing protein n=1 Tax=uncultured Dysosmobacter sp. TaxID=2591384 RepID=UPI00263139E6|nr:helix-turn-helix transcriptional regulator [uncultured Dysosmobacter sp.]
MSKFSDNLVYLRKRDGLSQEELSQKIKMSRSTVGMLESGSRMPSRETLETLADVFNVSTDFLIGRVDSGENSRIFRDNLSRIINSRSKADLAAAGINLYEVGLIIDGTISLSFDCACHLADQLGVSLDEMLGKESPVTMTDDEVLNEIIHLLAELPSDKIHAATEYLRFLSRSEDK